MHAHWPELYRYMSVCLLTVITPFFGGSGAVCRTWWTSNVLDVLEASTRQRMKRSQKKPDKRPYRHQEEHWWWISTHEALHAVWKHLCSSAKGHEADCDSAEMDPDHKCDSHLSGIEAALLQFTSTTWKLEIIKPSDRKFSLISCLLF